jgi:flagellin-like protein
MVMKSRKAISPVIATVILVAVAITIAVAVSYWMSGISSSYTKFEKVEIQSSQCVKTGTAGTVNAAWNVTLSLKNSGSATSTINGVYVNDQIATLGQTIGTNSTLRTDVPAAGLTIASGGTTTVKIFVGQAWPATAHLTSGTTVNIKIHSAGGMDYIKLIELV